MRTGRRNYMNKCQDLMRHVLNIIARFTGKKFHFLARKVWIIPRLYLSRKKDKENHARVMYLSELELWHYKRRQWRRNCMGSMTFPCVECLACWRRQSWGFPTRLRGSLVIFQVTLVTKSKERMEIPQPNISARRNACGSRRSCKSD
jgi:hypothetical protein